MHIKMLPSAAPGDRGAASWEAWADGDRVGRVSLWWRSTAPYQGQKTGYIGQYEARDRAVAEKILTFACAELRRQGCQYAIAPIDGDTWHSYRLVTERAIGESEFPPFFLEVDTPDRWMDDFASQGFAAIARYYSAVDEIPAIADMSGDDDRVALLEARFWERGVRVRSLNLDDGERELRRIYDIAKVSFRQNFLYTPIALADLYPMYLPLLPFIDPRFIFIAETDRPVGFLFALPNVLGDPVTGRIGEKSDALIVKTLAVLPGREFAGLGRLLLQRCLALGRSLGYRRAIYALMHEGNSGRNLVKHARPMRRYALLGRQL